MAEVPKLLYVVVADGTGGGGEGPSSFRYTRPVLQSTLQLMGCKARHAFKISRRVFEVMRIKSGKWKTPSGVDSNSQEGGALLQRATSSPLVQESVETNSALPFELYKRLTTVVVTRDTFLDVACDALSQYKYVGPNQRADLVLACRIRERKESVTVLLCGTSGCGKSTLSALLGSRLGITTVVSTDSIRHMMRSFADEKENPLLWASTYHAGDCLDPEAIAEAKVRKKANKLAGVSHSITKEERPKGGSTEKHDSRPLDMLRGTEFIGKRQMAIEGYKAQSEMVIDSLDRLITAWEEQKKSVVVEGVHLSLNFVMGLMKKHPSIIPFMIYITNEGKHMERFAVRAKYMTLDPAKNKYVKYINNIRTIQDYLCNRADRHLVPKVNNTNVDRSVAVIHATVFGCLRRREAGEKLYDPTTKTVPLVDDEYRKCAASSLSSKGMFQLIQRNGSSRHLIALINTDGSVAKAWPVRSVDGNGKDDSVNRNDKCVGNPMYGPLLIGRAEPVNLQFGNLGLSAWPSDTGGTSNASSIDESRTDGTDTGSRYYSSCCSSPHISDGPAKELREEFSVSGSDEEAVDPHDADSDEDLSENDTNIHEDIEGSVDEESTKSDEEYEDLAMQDDLEHGYWSDEDESNNREKNLTGHSKSEEYPEADLKSNTGEKKHNNKQQKQQYSGEKYRQNLYLFQKLSDHIIEPLSSLLSEENQISKSGERMKKRSLSDSFRLHNRSWSISAFGKSESVYGEPIVSGALKG